VTIKGPAGGVAFVIIGAEGAPISAGGGVTSDCATLAGSTTLFLLKDDATATFHGLPAGQYTVLMAKESPGTGASDAQQSDVRWDVNHQQQATVGADAITIDLTKAST